MAALLSLDAQFFAAERSGAESHYCGLAIYATPGGERPITAATVIQRVRERIDKCPPLQWKVVTVPFGLDHPVFVDVDVDPADHVSEVVLPPEADDAALRQAVTEDLKSPLDRDRPLWRIRVFHGLADRTAVAITLHHGVVDGLSAKEIFGILLDAEDGAQTRRPSVASARPRGISRLMLAARAVVDAPARTVRSIGNVAGALGHLDQSPVLRSIPGVQELARIARRDLQAAGLHAPRTRFNARLSGTRSNGFGSVSLDEVKMVKRHLGVTVNDVVLAACAGAVRRRLLAAGELPDEPLVAYVPVSVRLPENRFGYGNAITSIVAPLPTHLADPRERVAYVHDVMKRAKDRSQEAPPSLLSDVNDAIPTMMFGLAARGVMDLISSPLVRPPVNLIVSNVPGPPVALKLLGAPLLAHYPLSLIFDGLALNITVVSYQNNMDIGIVGDAQAVADVPELVDELRAEFAELTRLVADRRN